MNFTEMGLIPELLQSVAEMGFQYPTPIQEKIIPQILTNHNDLVGLAQTGTGKTAAFGLPILQNIEMSGDDIQALILCPTRELCLQITNDFMSYARHLPAIKVSAVYGGASITAQIRELRDKPQIVAGTPGRILDMIKRKALKINNIKYLVLDEADEMLNMGFKNDMDAILENTPASKRTFLFSATMPVEIRDMALRYMHKPLEITVGKRNAGPENVFHYYYVVNPHDRYEALKRIIDFNPEIYGIIFCRTRNETKEIADKLMLEGYNADTLHGDLSQAQRDYVMNRFRLKHIQLLVATDVAARGLDVSDLTHIINYNLPDDMEVYTHRSGRTGRAGKEGISVSIISKREADKIRHLERSTGKHFIQQQVPGGNDICEKQLFNLIDKVEKIEVDESLIHKYLPVIFNKLAWLDREQLIKHFVSIEFNRFLNYYKNAADLSNVRTEAINKLTGDGDRKMNFTRFHINIGSKNKLSAARLMGLINDQTKNRRIKFGKIEILNKFTIFEAES
ncbi:MAG TPA: DEAD/DEAH box helicase, partial [Bacteroidia bacterium]|nr:DEAD/DEAH box helicase [Bacteroidia bacterium]